jgi:hypothetical protein
LKIISIGSLDCEVHGNLTERSRLASSFSRVAGRRPTRNFACAENLMRLGKHVRVIGPPELRTFLAETAARIYAAGTSRRNADSHFPRGEFPGRQRQCLHSQVCITQSCFFRRHRDSPTIVQRVASLFGPPKPETGMPFLLDEAANPGDATGKRKT